MKKQVIMTVGAPGSGKSTWATEQAKDKKVKTIVLCRDDFRAMFFGGEYKYSRANEKLVMTSMLTSLTNAIYDESVQRIIIADTNLNLDTRTDFCKAVDVFKTQEIEVSYKIFDVPWTTLVERNKVRGNKSVPIDVLRSMYKNMQIYLFKHKQYVPDESKPKAIIVDIDGTIADNSSRHAFAYDRLGEDKPIQKIIDLVKMYEASGHEIICVSGRNAGNKEFNRCYHRLTSDWLIHHEVPYDSLHMRAWDDFRKDDIVKEEIFWDKIADKYNVVLALDDRAQVVELWRRIGVSCLQVAHGDF